MTFSQQYENILLALCVWREARGCSMAAQTAVVWAILNRTSDPQNRWPKDIASAILQPHRFSSFNPDSVKLPQPADPSWLDCCAVVATPLGDDPVKGAQFYHSIPAGEPWPQWAHDYRETVQIGPFRFYRA